MSDIDSSGLSNFDFVQDEFLRQSLALDFQELSICFKSGAYKATQVIGGALVEALLLDFLMFENKVQTKEEAQSLSLENLIDRAFKEKLISRRAKEQAMLIKHYRNLIHQGRAMREKETVDQDGAMTTVALVNILVREIAQSRKNSYGLTAEQVVAKALRDRQNESVLPHLLRDMRMIEIERLLLHVIFDRYMEYDPYREEFENMDPILRKLYRLAFDLADTDTKRKVVSHICNGVREWDSVTLRTRIYDFVRGFDIAYANDADAEVILDYLMSALNRDIDADKLQVFRGIEDYVNDRHVRPLIYNLAIISDLGTGDSRTLAWNLLSERCTFVPEHLVDSFNTAIQSVASQLAREKMPNHSQRVKNLVAAAFDPFADD